MTKAKAAVQAASGTLPAQTAIAGLTPLSKKPPTGKTIYIILCGTPACDFEQQQFEAAGKALGWNIKTVEGGTPEATKAAWSQAVQAKPSGVVGCCIPRPVIATQLNQLKAEHVPVVMSAVTDKVAPPVLGIIWGQPSIEKVGKLLANWMIADTNGKANAVFFTIPSLPILPPQLAGFQQVMAECKTCKYAVKDEPLTAIGQNMPALMTAYIQAHPDVNYVTAGWDDMTLGLPAALKAAGLDSQVKMVGFAPGTPANLGYIANGQVEVAYIPNPYGTIMWRVADAFARYFVGDSTAVAFQNANQIPISIYTKSNLGDPSHVPADNVTGYPAEFEKLWHVGG